jgi:Lysylphosphatidylglycerol synthase TM region
MARSATSRAGNGLLRGLRRWLSTHHLEHTPRELTWCTALAVALAAGATVGVAWVAGFGEVAHVLRHGDWIWIVPALAAEAIAYVGYTLAYPELARVDGGRPLRLPRAVAAVVSGFGLFIPRGGFSADYHAFVDIGFSEREARLRVLALGALEYVVLAPAVCGAAIFMLVNGGRVPVSFSYPWAIAVPAGFALAVVLMRWHRAWHGRPGWRGWIAGCLDIVALLQRLATRPRDHGVSAGAGMLLYWAGDVFALWACLRVFLGGWPAFPVLLIGYATGYALTRRTLPLAGAGTVEALLPLSLSWIGIALAPAVLAVSAYRILNLWVPFVPALVGRRSMRRQLAEDITAR